MPEQWPLLLSDGAWLIMCSFIHSFTHTCAFVLLKGKVNTGQKETPEETNQVKEKRHGNMSVPVLMYTLFN